MAVELEYADSDLQAGKKANPALSSKAESYSSVAIREVVSGASNLSIYKMFANLNPELILSKIEIFSDAFGASGVMEIGIYKPGADGAAIDDNVFAASVDISSAIVAGNGMVTVNAANRQLKLWEHAGDSLATKDAEYDIGIKLTNVGATGLGTITLIAYFIQG